MAVAVEKRPIGVKLGSAVTASINQDYSTAFATVNKTAHGLSDGNYVYVRSNVESYNGFWRVDVRNVDEFLLIDSPYVPWVVNADITYYPQVATHGWSAVHNPIVYELSNTRFPINTVDTARTVSSISNDAGYLNLNLSGSLGTFEELSFLKISNAANSNLNGVYQIIDKVNTDDVTVNLAYSAVTNDGILGATVQLYYSNYNVIVRIYAGINSSHQWASLKPYELAATLQFIPDSSNRIKFSVNEILKAYVETKNNLALDSLPNNTDFWTQFYIEVAEQYDTSNGYTVGTFTGGFVSDQANFEGYGVNAQMPFKNIYSGYLSDYMNNKFLTLFAIPVLFACSEDTPDCYQDVSFINGYSSSTNIKIRKQYYINGIFQTTETDSISSAGEGLYRVGISPNCTYDRVDVTVLSDLAQAQLSTFGQKDIPGGGIALVYNSATTPVGPSLQVTESPGQSSTIGYVKFQAPPGTYDVGGTTNVTVLSGTGTYNVLYYLLDDQLNIIDSDGSTVTPGSPDGTIVTLVSTVQIAYIGVQFIFSSGSGSVRFNGDVAIQNSSADNLVISETKQYRIDCGCANQEMRLSWLNNLGGFDYFTFQAEKDNNIEIGESGTTSENIFPQWPKSYDETADTIKKQTFRNSNEAYTVRSQHLTQDEADAIAYIKSSVLVQIVNSRLDRRTVLVDTDSFMKYKDADKTYTIQFNISYTNNLPAQTA